jgi:hypothetical protein
MVSVDHLEPAAVARAHRAIEPLHSHLYFAPEHDERFSALGLKPGRMSYFAGRAAPMGAVGAGVVTATFYNFSPSLVAHMIPRAWRLASPEQVLAARLDAARATRGWGDEEWAAGCAALADRGLLDDAGLTEDGESLRAHIEAQTDALSADPWLLLGAERTARVVELGKGLSRRLVEGGAFGRGIFAGS